MLKILAVVVAVLTVAGAKAGSLEKVRVKLLQLPLPLEISGEGLTVSSIKKNDFQKMALPKTETMTINARKIEKQKIWIIKKGEVTSRSSESFVEVNSSSGKARILGYNVPTPFLLSLEGHSPNVADLIGAFNLEDYLVGVLMSEMPGSWPLEALKAQAVAARSYTVFQMEARKKQAYHLESNVLDQGYTSPSKSPTLEKIRQAVNETQSEVLLYNGRVTKAYYHSDCGGQTEEPNLVWKGETASIGTTIDTHCPFNRNGKWTFEISANRLREKMESAGYELPNLKDLQIVTRTPSKRVALLAFNEGAHSILVSGQDVRQILGFDKLKSTMFSVVTRDDSVVFTGQGYGHGSGLCQWGAKFMAEKGAKAPEILKHYYPRAQVLSAN